MLLPFMLSATVVVFWLENLPRTDFASLLLWPEERREVDQLDIQQTHTMKEHWLLLRCFAGKAIPEEVMKVCTLVLSVLTLQRLRGGTTQPFTIYKLGVCSCLGFACAEDLNFLYLPRLYTLWAHSAFSLPWIIAIAHMWARMSFQSVLTRILPAFLLSVLLHALHNHLVPREELSLLGLLFRGVLGLSLLVATLWYRPVGGDESDHAQPQS